MQSRDDSESASLHDHDIAVLGAGAAGLCAAIRAGELGARVVLLEKNRRPGVKILMSGGTRCNLTNARGLRNLRVVGGPIDPGYDPARAKGARSIQAAFGAGGAFLGPALEALGVEETVRLFEGEGVATKVEANGKIFPLSDRAVDVLDALLRRLARAGATLRTQTPVTALLPVPGGWRVVAREETLSVRRVIVTMGGESFPGCGTRGDGYALARALGHTIVPPVPALVPLRVDAAWVPTLSGLTIPDANAAVLDADGKRLAERREAVLFTHSGLSGPAILDVSRAVGGEGTPGPTTLMLDFFPDLRPEQLDQSLQSASRMGRRPVKSLLPAALPRRLVEALMDHVEIPRERWGPDLSREERRRLVHACKGLRLAILGTLGFAKAEVTRGGVALDEVDPRSMESRRHPGLYFAGEVLDLDGQIGGYNFQAAWSTGWLAGQSAATGREDRAFGEAHPSAGFSQS